MPEPPTRAGTERRTPVRTGGRLMPGELAEAAVLADVTVSLCLFGFLLPAGGFFIVLGAVPMAALGARHRPRTVLAGALAGLVTSLLIGGSGLTSSVLGCAVIGGYSGLAIRWGWSRTRTVAIAGIGLWPPLAGLLLALLAVLTQLRQLILVQVTNSWRGVSKLLGKVGLQPVTHIGDVTVKWLIDRWWLSGPLGLLAMILLAVWVGYGLARATVARLHATSPPATDLSTIPGSNGITPVGPVPVDVANVMFRYDGASVDALQGVSLTVEAADFVAVVGPNGSGKSTLAGVLAGRPPTAGVVRRPGAPGLGHRGGTSLVFQRPETQVLGVRARDDVVWGLPPGSHVDVAGLLDRVGLAGFADRETSTLSGGELQRLALAAALARSPSLLISDETTAMVDPEGRVAIVDLLRGAAAGGVAVVHVTHRWEEAAGATQLLTLDRGRAVDGAAAPSRERRPPLVLPPGPIRVELDGVGHVYAIGTPWEHRALVGVDLVVRGGDGVLLTGANGSGKSTLAWVLAGLIRPTEGGARLEGRTLSDCVGHVGVAFQHARLQLLRPRVRSDVQSAGGVGQAAADRALMLVGLDPADVGDRRVDELSGGQQRRVALAGVLAADPRVVVLDEPFAGLDESGQAGLAGVIVRLRENGTAVIVVSHDTEGLGDVLDREVRLDGGRLVRDSANVTGRPGQSQPRPSAAASRRKAPRDLQLFRLVPGDSVVHRLWAGTKLLALVGLSTALSFAPGWASVGVAAACVGASFVLARIPRGAAPRLPRWFFVGLGIGALLDLVSGGKPEVTIGGMVIGLGALGDWARVTAFAFVLLGAAAVLSWTTPLADVAPAMHKLAAPGRWLRLPVDEWVTALALCFRCLPLLIDETRTLTAVRRLRAARSTGEAHPSRVSRQMGVRLVNEAIDLLNAEMVVALRRARELGSAMDARGGIGTIADDRARPRLRDAVALTIVALVVTAILIV